MTKQKCGRIFLIINKYAGHQEGGKAIDQVVPWLVKQGCQVEFAFTQYPGHATELALKASTEGFDLVVAVGGDGTVNETAQGLIGSSTPLGIVPVGSGNGLARELGISTNMRKSSRHLLEGTDLQIDVCRINQQRFLCTSGIGFDARVADLMSKASSRGFMRYIQLVIKESILYSPLNIKMKIDGQPLNQPAFLITFANASQFGNNAFIAPAASMTDGLIDVVVVKPFSKLWLPVFAVALFGKFIHQLPFVECYKAREIELEWTDTSIFHFDGEPGQLSVPAMITIDRDKIFVRR
ncbi:MAG TPA: diacylglycerol kinase family protein [Prolixibacteraceae bacterium]